MAPADLGSEHLYLIFKANFVGAHHVVALLSIFEQNKRGHGADTVLLGDWGDLVDIDGDKHNILVLFRQLFENRADETARAAPSSHKVDSYLRIFPEDLFELLCRRDFYDRHLVS